jgi:hypothetical protein
MPMTFLTTRYRLSGALTSKELSGLNRLSTTYGIRGISIDGQDLVVEYDASRIHEAEVLAQIRSAGIPVQPQKPIAPGACDYTGEFRDFAWPVQGLTPVNAKQK